MPDTSEILESDDPDDPGDALRVEELLSETDLDVELDRAIVVRLLPR